MSHDFRLFKANNRVYLTKIDENHDRNGDSAVGLSIVEQPPREGHAFPPSHRLRSKADFAAMRGARRLQFDGFRFVQRPNNLPHGRIGFAVSCKYGNSVARHHLKRVVRETFRHHDARLQAVDILLIPCSSSQTWQGRGEALKAAIQGGLDRVLKRSRS
ncbi:MAG: ribonuclease P protein component [Mariprofundaceae bacterium]|nr:ribonuclease P protein component [Mariprofundaceae bacterium]